MSGAAESAPLDPRYPLHATDSLSIGILQCVHC
jgi:hypothetical protein